MASEIVVGIDFGTTYSGVSWAINGGNKKIRVVNDWPNPDSSLLTNDKVPTKITYQNWKANRWGYSIELKEQPLSWFKLLLDPNNKINKESDKVTDVLRQLVALNKSPEDIAADYLRKIWQYTKEDIQKVRGDDWAEIYTVRAVLTVPAIWSDSAKDRTMRIAHLAGLPEDISLVTEPEAAALAVLREKKDDGEPLQAGDCFVVCDAGGGTVDLISYKIVSLDPFQVEECAMGDGGLCGSVFLDQAFEKYIRTIVGEPQWQNLKAKSKIRMLKDWESAIKRCYSGDNTSYTVELPGVEDNASVHIEEEVITLKPTALKTIFDHVIGKILRLVEKQIDEVKERGSDVKAILLVGGFGTNRYMHQQLKEAYKRGGTQVLQIDRGWSAICRGATLWGLENAQSDSTKRRTVRSRIARYSYGIIVSREWDTAVGQLETDRLRGTKGEWRANNQMNWMLKKGERVEEGRTLHRDLFESVKVGFGDHGMYQTTSTLSYCAEDTPPLRAEPSVKTLCTVSYGIDKKQLYVLPSYKDPVTKEKWKDAFFDLYVKLNTGCLEFSVKYKGEQVAFTEANYKEDS